MIDSGEYGIGQYNDIWMIRKSKLFIPTIAPNKKALDKHDLLNALNAADVFSIELDQSVRDMKWQSLNCPFHEDSHPSFRILLPDGGFECKGCGETGGSVIDLAMQLHCLDFPQAINYLATRYTSFISD